MGRAFANRAIGSGHQVTVWNRTPGRAADVVSAGAVEASSLQAAAEGAEVVLVVVADDEAARQVCEGPDGVLAFLGPEAVLANVSTVSPATARHLASVGPDGRVLDTPVMGSPDLIAAGFGRFFIGGPAEAVGRTASLWEGIGSGYVHCGPTGAGATVKLISNLWLITGVTALAEGLAIARHHGIGDHLLRSVVRDSMVVSPASQARLDNVLDPKHPGWFTPALARKDVRLAVALAEEAGVGAQIGPATEALLTRVIDGGQEWQDFAAVIEALG